MARTYFSEQPPFAVSPSLFVLQPGEAIVVEVSLLWRLKYKQKYIDALLHINVLFDCIKTPVGSSTTKIYIYSGKS